MKKTMQKSTSSRANVLGHLLCRISTRLQNSIQRSLHHAGLSLTLPQWRILSVLAESKELSQSKLSSLTDKDRANVTRILEVLESSGFVERYSHADDKRRYTVVITHAGIEIEHIARALAAEVEQRMLNGIPVSERKSVLTQLQKMAENLE